MSCHVVAYLSRLYLHDVFIFLSSLSFPPTFLLYLLLLLFISSLFLLHLYLFLLHLYLFFLPLVLCPQGWGS